MNSLGSFLVLRKRFAQKCMVYFGISCHDALTFYLPPLAIIILSTLVHQQMLCRYCPPGLVSVREGVILSHATIQIKRLFYSFDSRIYSASFTKETQTNTTPCLRWHDRCQYIVRKCMNNLSLSIKVSWISCPWMFFFFSCIWPN